MNYLLYIFLLFTWFENSMALTGFINHPVKTSFNSTCIGLDRSPIPSGTALFSFML